jgi:hypothetical protein
MAGADHRTYVDIACGVVLVATCWLTCGCRRVGLSAAEKERIRIAVHEESEQHQAAQQNRDRAWAELRRQFDKDKNGTLSPTEESAMGRHLDRIKLGKEPGPFSQ